MCPDDLGLHQKDSREAIVWLRCTGVKEYHWSAVDDVREELCGCEQPLLNSRDPLEALWHLARAARLMDDDHLALPGERGRAIALAEAVSVATEKWATKAGDRR